MICSFPRRLWQRMQPPSVTALKVRLIPVSWLIQPVITFAVLSNMHFCWPVLEVSYGRPICGHSLMRPQYFINHCKYSLGFVIRFAIDEFPRDLSGHRWSLCESPNSSASRSTV